MNILVLLTDYKDMQKVKGCMNYEGNEEEGRKLEPNQTQKASSQKPSTCIQLSTSSVT